MISRTVCRTVAKSSGQINLKIRTLFRAFAEVSSPRKLKVNHYSQLNTFDYADVFNAIAFASNSERMADVIDVAAPMMTDQMLALSLRIMEQYEFQLGDAFHAKMLPFVREFTKLMDKNHTAAFAETMVSMGNLGVKDEEYWTICKDKLLKQGYERYVPLRNVGHLIKALANVGQADPELLRVLGAQVIKHQAGLKPENLEAAISGFEQAGVGAATFKKALADGKNESQNSPLSLH